MENNVIIATALNRHVRIYLFNSKEMVQKAKDIHNLWPTSCAALGRTLSVTALMGLMQKDEGEDVSVSINGGGEIGNILCVANNTGKVKGYCDNPHYYEVYENTHKLAVGIGVGTDGYLRVSKNLKLKQSYTSQVALQSGEIGDDFAYYFSVSEQIPSIVSVGVLVDVDDNIKSAGAMIIELLPNHEDSDVEYLENLNLSPISSVLAENDSIHDYLNMLFPENEILEERYVEYYCDCSKERFLSKLLTLPRKDLEEIVQDDNLNIRCEFCEKEYNYDKEDIKKIIEYVSDRK